MPTKKFPLDDITLEEKDLSHSMVHYLLSIHKLKEVKGYARVTDIARTLNLTKGSVSTALNNLKRKGLVTEEDDSKFLSLSEKGHQEVHQILSSRTLLFYFLRDILGASESVAQNDSCLMEHLLSDETRERFFDFMKHYSYSSPLEKHKKGGAFFKTSLDLKHFQNAKDFEEGQKGDAHLGQTLS
jgi:DtxR family Mn-dependent transcriptional regulator